MNYLDFIVERYNYWIFITLMMMGLYIVISRGNLIKKLIGLNVFQTSVFIYYISIGKIFGGTAPIYDAADYERRIHDESHGDAPGVEDGVGRGGEPGAEILPGKSEMGAGAIHGDDSLHDSFDHAGNNLAELTGEGGAAPEASAVHAAPAHGANEILATPTLTIPDGAVDHAAATSEGLHGAATIIYSNPLPHVLILTAIVVGIATTAVGLALVVRIREAYSTIEEDELEAADEIAEFGHMAQGGAAAA